MSGFNTSSAQTLFLLTTVSHMFPVIHADNSTQTSNFFSSTNATTSTAKDSFETAGGVALSLALACVVACLLYTLCKVCTDEFKNDSQVIVMSSDDPDYVDALTDTDDPIEQRSALQMV